MVVITCLPFATRHRASKDKQTASQIWPKQEEYRTTRPLHISVQDHSVPNVRQLGPYYKCIKTLQPVWSKAGSDLTADINEFRAT